MIKLYKTLHAFAVTTILVGSIVRAAEPTFHLKNNSADAIQIDIMQNNKSLTGLKQVAKGGEFEFMLDINKPTTVDINYCPTATYCKTNLPDKMIAKFKAGKTIYVKFDGKKVQPQKGNTLTGKTTAGYNSKNNVARADISVQAGKIKKSDLGITIPTVEAWKEFTEANKFRKSQKARLDYQHEDEKANAIKLAELVFAVQHNASKSEVNKAYKKLSLKYHPDRYTGDKKVGTEAFKIVNQAHALLSE